jgi:hypothetical protein
MYAQNKIKAEPFEVVATLNFHVKSVPNRGLGFGFAMRISTRVLYWKI